MKKISLWFAGTFALAGLIYGFSPEITDFLTNLEIWDWRKNLMLFCGTFAFVFMTLAMVMTAVHAGAQSSEISQQSQDYEGATEYAW